MAPKTYPFAIVRCGHVRNKRNEEHQLFVTITDQGFSLVSQSDIRKFIKQLNGKSTLHLKIPNIKGDGPTANFVLAGYELYYPSLKTSCEIE